MWFYDPWDWLATVPPGRESGSTTIRNVGLVIGGVIAIVLALWRSRVAQCQANTALKQSEIAERGLLNERYQKGAEMLGSKVLTVRLGGIYALQGLAEEHPEQYHVQIMRLFCAFVRHPTEDKDTAKSTDANETSSTKLDRIREDVQAAMTAIGTRSDANIALEEKENFFPELCGAKLPGAILHEANLSRTFLRDTDLSHVILCGTDLTRADLTGAHLTDALLGPPSALLPGAILHEADLTGADLTRADLTRVNLIGANLAGANLTGTRLPAADLTEANLTGARLSGAYLAGAKLTAVYLVEVQGLTQAQLDKAYDLGNQPILGGSRDAETGNPLVWHDKPCEVRT